MANVAHVIWIGVLVWLPRLFGIQERFVTELCPGSVGPTYGEVLYFDPDYNKTKWFVPNRTIDCWVTLRGMPTDDPVIPWYVALMWQGSFSVRGWDYPNTGCDTAFLEVYDVAVEGATGATPVQGPLCGETAPADFTTPNQDIVIHLYVEKKPDSPTPIQMSTTPPVTDVTSDPVTDTRSVTGASATVTTLSVYDGPYIVFRLDFTSYFIDCASDGSDNDAVQLQCDTSRCIDITLRCDHYGADNCGDGGDQSKQAPGNCTVIPPPEQSQDKLLPLWIVLGILGMAFLCYWLCWRPGMLPWRLARLRNVPCCHRASDSCRRMSCTKSDTCRRLDCRTSTRTESGYPDKVPSDVDINEVDGEMGWLSFANSDGMHLREVR